MKNFVLPIRVVARPIFANKSKECEMSVANRMRKAHNGCGIKVAIEMNTGGIWQYRTASW